MGIRNLDVYLADHQILQTGPLSYLKGCKIAIEGHLWLRKLLNGTSKDPSTVAMGGAPIGLEDYIKRDLSLYKEKGIQATYVFNSLSPVKKEKPFSGEDKRPAKRAQAWDAYEKGNSELSISLWNSAISVYQPELMNLVMKVLHEENQSFIRAPYSSWAQMCYLFKNEQFHGMLAGTECLMFECEKIITSINFEKDEFTFVHKSKILQEMQVNEEQFLDICVFAGFEYSSTFPPLSGDGISFQFKAALDMIRQYKTGFNAVQAFADHSEVVRTSYNDNFCRTISSIKFHPYLSSTGLVEPFNAETAPNDLQTFMGHRLPDEVYYYMSRGLISHHIIVSLISGVIVDNQPLCNGEFKEYQKLLKDLLTIRSQTLALLTRHLHGVFQSRKLQIAYWFEPKEEHFLIPYDNVIFPKLHTSKWRCDEILLSKQVEQQKFDGESNLFFAIVAAKSPKFLDIDENTPPSVMNTTNQVVFTTIIRFLELRELLNHPKANVPYAKALMAAIDGYEGMPDDIMEGLIVALELIKLDLLTDQPFDPEFSDPHMSHVPDSEKRHVRLFSRVLSLLPMTFERAPWVGPVNRNLLCFQSCFKALTRNLRYMVEMVSMGVLLGKEAVTSNINITEVALRLPFSQEPNTALGMLGKFYLDKVCHSPQTEVQHWLEPSQLPKTFSCCADVEEDLARGFDFWDQLVVAVETLSSSLDKPLDIVKSFKEADEWLKNKRF